MSTALQGKHILVTREKKQAKEFHDKIIRFGGIPHDVPLLQIACIASEETEQTLFALDRYEWIFFTSANGVACFFELLKKYGIDAKRIENKQLATVGHKTEKILRANGFKADFIPTIYDAEHMASEFLARYRPTEPILLIRGNLSRNVLPIEFSKLGIPFDCLELYKTEMNHDAKELLNRVLIEEKLDYMTFTSPSTIDAFMQFAQDPFGHDATCVCIGSTSEKRAKEAGFQRILVPEQFTIDSMLDCISNDIAQKG